MIPYYDNDAYDRLSIEIVQLIYRLATDYDHKEDAHKYNTPCFVCNAEKLADQLNIQYKY